MAYNINSNIFEKYTECIRYNCICELISNINKFDRALREQKKYKINFSLPKSKIFGFESCFVRTERNSGNLIVVKIKILKN